MVDHADAEILRRKYAGAAHVDISRIEEVDDGGRNCWPAMGEMALRERDFFAGVGNEFYLTLSASGPGCSVDRLALARRISVEQALIAVGAETELSSGAHSD